MAGDVRGATVVIEPHRVLAQRTVPVHLGWTWSNGRLLIYPGRIVLRTSPFLGRFGTAEEVVHTHPEVTLITASLLPPWMDVTLVVEGDRQTGTALMTIFQRAALRRDLERAGFNVVMRETWFSWGGDYLR